MTETRINAPVILILAAGLGLVACAHHRDVRPGPGGVHRVVVQAADTEEGSRDALAQANHFCKETGQFAAIVGEDHKYTGDLDEKVYRNAKRAAKVAKSVGLPGRGGEVADQAIGDGYTVEMKFQCK